MQTHTTHIGRSMVVLAEAGIQRGQAGSGWGPTTAMTVTMHVLSGYAGLCTRSPQPHRTTLSEPRGWPCSPPPPGCLQVGEGLLALGWPLQREDPASSKSEQQKCPQIGRGFSSQEAHVDQYPAQTPRVGGLGV